MDSDIHTDSSSSLDESGESADENDFNDACSLKKRILQLPECFCSEEEVFKEVLSPATWKSVLNSKHGDRLKKFLPSFPENDEKEKNETLRKLIDGENFKFGSPLKHFFNKLKEIHSPCHQLQRSTSYQPDGFLSSDVVEVNNALRKANYREYKDQQQQYAYHLLQDILISRKKLMEAAYNLPPDQSVKMQQFIAKPKDATLLERTRLRYFSTLQDMREELGELDTSSEDENYPESNAPKVFRKYKKQQHLHEASLSPELSRISATTSYPPGYPGSGHIFSHCVEMFEVSEERYREMLHNHKNRMTSDPNNPKLIISQIDLKDVTARSNIGKRPSNKNVENLARKKSKGVENSDKSINSSVTDSVEGETSLSNTFNREESSYNSSGTITTTITTTTMTASDIMPPALQENEVQTDLLTVLEEGEDSQTVIDTHHQNIKLPSPLRPEVHQYPTCFFALLRDIFCESAEQKLSAIKLEEKVRNWQGGPTASLFEWLNYQESWADLVSSALKFLAGDLINILPDTFVPFLDYKEKQQQWQWIGSGRDSDEQMYGLCQQWLENKDDITSDILEACQGSPPPPRVTTGWTVRPTAEEEKNVYRDQECVRYQNPHKAFTFKVHGYEAVVGPVKGVYGKESGINKAREHSLLTSDRPPFVTILSLVRDSAARLPNGEGTRADICELLKDSQYLSPASDQQIHTVVSGALDRLHYEKDPCVKYDVNRKLWIYLHRHRTEEEFERIHQAQAAAAKARKAVQKSKLPKFGVYQVSEVLKVAEKSRTEKKSPKVMEKARNSTKNKDIARALSTAHVASSSENCSLLNVDIPPGMPVQSPRGSSSPRTQGSPKPGHASSRYVMHTLTTPNQTEIKCAVLSVESQNKSNEGVQNDSTSPSNISSDNKQAIASIIAAQEANTSRQSTLGSALQLSNAKNTIGNVAATQIVSVTPVQLKTVKTEPGLSVNAATSHVHDVLNVDIKPSSPSFVGQPPILQPILSHTNVEVSNSHANASTSTSPPLISTTVASAPKTKVNCANLPGLPGTIAGFQTIVIKQEPGLRSCNGVSTIPLLSIEERLPSTNPSALNSGPVVARLVHGSQYLSFCNIAASSTTCSSTKPITAAVQNFRVQGGNICQQVLSTSTIKVINSSPVPAITDTRVPVIALKNQISSGKEPTILTQSPAALNVCGRLYQMTNIRNAVISKDITDTKSSDTAPSKDTPESSEKEMNITALPIPTISYSGAVPITARTTQTVLKVSPK